MRKYQKREKDWNGFQDFKLLQDRNLRKYIPSSRVLGYSATDIRSRVEEAIEMVGLDGKEEHLPSEISGGEHKEQLGKSYY